MNALYKNIYTLIFIFLGKSGPKHLVKSIPQLVILICAFVVVDSVLMAKSSAIAQKTMVYASVIKLIFFAGGLWFWLRLNEVSDRFMQTATTLFAVGVLAQLLKTPLLPVNPKDSPLIAALSALVLLWQFVVSVKSINSAAKNSFLKTGLLVIALHIGSFMFSAQIMTAVVGSPIHTKPILYSGHK